MRCLIALTLLLPTILYARLPENVEPDPDKLYHVRLLSGDILIGSVVEISEDGDEVRLRTSIGIATIFVSQIAEFIPRDEVYPHSHRLFYMPTSEPVGNNLYVGLYELLMPYAGVGIADLFSFTGGRTMVPGINPQEQASVFNLKITVSRPTGKQEGVSYACGLNMSWLNAPNDMGHAYSTATWNTGRLSLTGIMFVKVYGSDEIPIRAGNYGGVDMRYATGTVGMGLGVDMPVTLNRFDLHLIGELWCSDVSKPDRSAAIIGFRLWNTDVAADFGLAIFPQPAVAPVMNIVWTPRIRD